MQFKVIVSRKYLKQHADWAWTYEHYIRDVPGSFEFWMENMMDQSHVAFSHSGLAGTRYRYSASAAWSVCSRLALALICLSVCAAACRGT